MSPTRIYSCSTGSDVNFLKKNSATARKGPEQRDVRRCVNAMGGTFGEGRSDTGAAADIPDTAELVTPSRLMEEKHCDNSLKGDR